jgi:hypothetical protein
MNRTCRAKAAAAVAALVLLILIVSVASAEREDPPGGIVFTQQDVVQAFDLQAGTGYQIGTATASISGTTWVGFQIAPTGPPVGDALPISFQNKVVITDVEGDQIFFDNNGTGSYHLGIPRAEFKGFGGPLTGTYVLTGGTGKYQTWKVGKTYRYRAVWTNPPNPPGALGTVYAEISLHKEHGEYGEHD